MRHSAFTRRTALAIMAVATIPIAAVCRAQTSQPDPILAAIDRHQALWAAFVAVNEEGADLSHTIPFDRQSSGPRNKVFPNNDPRWTEYDQRWWAASDAADDAAWELINSPPATLVGLALLLVYAVEFVKKGYEWPAEWENDLLSMASRMLVNPAKLATPIKRINAT